MKTSRKLLFVALAFWMFACQFCKPTATAVPMQEAAVSYSPILGMALHIGELKDAAPDVAEDQSVLSFSLSGYPVKVEGSQEIVHYPTVKVFPVREGATQLSFIANLSVTNFGDLFLGDYIQQGTRVNVDGIDYGFNGETDVTFGPMGVEIKLTPMQ